MALFQCVTGKSGFVCALLVDKDSNDGPCLSVWRALDPVSYQESPSVLDTGQALAHLPAGDPEDVFVQLDLLVLYPQFVILSSTRDHLRRWCLHPVLEFDGEPVYECLSICEDATSTESACFTSNSDGSRSVSCEGHTLVVRSDEMRKMAVLRSSEGKEVPCAACFEESDGTDSSGFVIATYSTGRVIGWNVLAGTMTFVLDQLSHCAPRAGVDAASSSDLLPFVLPMKSESDDQRGSVIRIIIGSHDCRIWSLTVAYDEATGQRVCRECGSLNIKGVRTGISSPVVDSFVSRGDLERLLALTEVKGRIIASTTEGIAHCGDTKKGLELTEKTKLKKVFTQLPAIFSQVTVVGYKNGLDRNIWARESELHMLVLLLSTFDRQVLSSFVKIKKGEPPRALQSPPSRATLKYVESGNNCTTSEGSDEYELSFFPDPDYEVPEKSPLLKTVGPSTASAKHLGVTGALVSPALGRGGWNEPRALNGRVVDLPVTFNTRIKSSGYGQASSRSLTKGGRGSRRRTGGKTGGRNVARDSDRRLRLYPVDCGVMATHQQHNDYFVPGSYGGAVTGQGPSIYEIEYTSDASSMALATADTAVSSLKLPIGRFNGDGSTYMGHDGRITSVSCSKKKGLVLSASADGSARIWCGARHDSAAVVFSHRQRHSAQSGTGPGTLGSGSTSYTAKKDDLRNKPFGSEVNCARFFRSDDFVTLICRGSAYLYTYDIGEAALSNDIHRLQTTGKYSLAHEWSLGAHTVTALACMNSVRSHLIMTSTSDRRLLILDAAAGQVAREISSPHERPIHTIALPSPSTSVQLPPSAYNVFATGAADGTVAMWDLRMSCCAARFSGHINRRDRVGVALSPCLRFLATGSEDKSARVVDIVSGKELAKLTNFKDVVSSVAFNPLYPQLAAASFDGSIKFYCDTALGATATQS